MILFIFFVEYLNSVNFVGTHYVVPTTRLIAVGWGQTNDGNVESCPKITR
jgi:hypothetical protein